MSAAEKNQKTLEEIGIGKNFIDQLCQMVEGSYLFKNFSRQEIEQMVEYMHAYRAPKDALLMQEGKLDSYLIIITQGKAKVMKSDNMGNQKQIASIHRGAIRGEMSVIDEFPHSASVVTTVPSEIALLTKTNLKKITEKYPSLGVKLLWQIAWQLSARLRQTSGKLVDFID